MIFNELIYYLFLAVAVFIFFSLPRTLRAWWLGFLGIVFYAYYAGSLVFLFLFEAVTIYFLSKTSRKNATIFVFLVSLCVCVLAYFKYRNTLLLGLFRSLGTVTDTEIPTLASFILPLGISFYTFEFIQYIVDFRKGEIVHPPFKDYLAFNIFFPTLVAGPIKRFQDFAPQLEAARFSYNNLNTGITRILIGAAKKVIIADSMNFWVQPLLQSKDAIASTGTAELWVALFAYSIKIYMDFSGYSDIAIGSAKLFGLTVPENFNAPYLRSNIAEFWRNWHISLTTWITRYVYIPLGGSRVRLRRVIFNVMVAMAVSGLWHGSRLHFLFWGLYHGALLAVYRIYRSRISPYLPNVDRPYAIALKPLSIAFTFVCVTIGWGLFVMPIENFVILVKRLFAISAIGS